MDGENGLAAVSVRTADGVVPGRRWPKSPVFLWKEHKMREFRYFDVEQRGPITEIRLADTKFFSTERYGELRDELVPSRATTQK